MRKMEWQACPRQGSGAHAATSALTPGRPLTKVRPAQHEGRREREGDVRGEAGYPQAALRLGSSLEGEARIGPMRPWTRGSPSHTPRPGHPALSPAYWGHRTMGVGWPQESLRQVHTGLRPAGTTTTFRKKKGGQGPDAWDAGWDAGRRGGGGGGAGSRPTFRT